MTGHLTAGDILPISAGVETAYGTPNNTQAYYADVKGDSGSITITDNPNPYVAWRSGDRSFAYNDLVAQQKLAGFKDVLEVRDVSGWDTILTQALGTASGTQALGKLPSRTVQIGVTGGSGIKYIGCKTDELVVKGEAPGAVVSFEETVMASWSVPISGAVDTGAAVNAYALQWVGPVLVGSDPIYPQSFELRIKNNLDRVLAYDSAKGGSYTAALPEGKREIELDLEVWREDLQDIFDSRLVTTESDIQLTLGTAVPKNITLTNVAYMSDGNISPLVQDKQRTTLRFRATGISVATPSP